MRRWFVIYVNFLRLPFTLLVSESLFHVMMIIAFFLPSFSLSPHCLFITKHSTEKIEGKVWKMLTLYVNSVLITHIYSINLDITELCDVFFIEIWALNFSSNKTCLTYYPTLRFFNSRFSIAIMHSFIIASGGLGGTFIAWSILMNISCQIFGALLSRVNNIQLQVSNFMKYLQIISSSAVTKKIYQNRHE